MATRTSNEHVANAEAAVARGDLPAAVNELESAFVLDETNDELPLLAAGLHFRQGDLDRAVRSALEVLRIRPFHPSAMHLLGVACLDAGHGDLARKILQRVCRLAPGFRQAKKNLKLARRAPRKNFRDDRSGATRCDLPTEAILELVKPGPPRLTACIFVTDEASSPAGCVAAASRVADEIVVLDATSDASVSTRLSEHDRVTVYRCSGSAGPAAARNELLRLAAGDWILILDATEHLEAPAEGELAGLLARPAVLSHAVIVRHEARGTAVRQARLVRNASGIRFDGAVAPSLERSLNELAKRWGLSRNRSDLVVVSDSVEPAVDYWKPEIEALRSELENRSGVEPGTPPHRLLEARLALAEGRAERARAVLEGTAAAAGPHTEEMTTVLGLALMRLQRFPELAVLITRFHRRHEPTHNTLFLCGAAFRAGGDSKAAVEALRRSAALRPQAAWLPPLPEILGSALPNLLGAALIDLGDLQAAREVLEQALACDPGNLESRLALLGLRMAAGETGEFLHELDRMVEEQGHRSQVWLIGGALLAGDARLAPTALHWAREACRRFPSDLELRNQLRRAQLRSGEVSEGLKAWSEKIPATAAERAEIFAARLAVGEQPPEVPEQEREAIRDEVIGWFGRWLASEAFEPLDRALLDIARGENLLPGLAAHTSSWLESVGQAEAAARILERTETGGATTPS